MTQDEIMELARQAGFEKMGIWNIIGIAEYHEAFAKLCFEKGRQQGIEQERALWKLAQIHKEMGGL